MNDKEETIKVSDLLQGLIDLQRYELVDGLWGNKDGLCYDEVMALICHLTNPNA